MEHRQIASSIPASHGCPSAAALAALSAAVALAAGSAAAPPYLPGGGALLRPPERFHDVLSQRSLGCQPIVRPAKQSQILRVVGSPRRERFYVIDL